MYSYLSSMALKVCRQIFLGYQWPRPSPPVFCFDHHPHCSRFKRLIVARRCCVFSSFCCHEYFPFLFPLYSIFFCPAIWVWGQSLVGKQVVKPFGNLMLFPQCGHTYPPFRIHISNKRMPEGMELKRHGLRFGGFGFPKSRLARSLSGLIYRSRSCWNRVKRAVSVCLVFGIGFGLDRKSVV